MNISFHYIGADNMTSNERKTTEKQAAVLLNDLDPAIAASVVDRFGDIHSMGSWDLEEMLDDLLTISNEYD